MVVCVSFRIYGQINIGKYRTLELLVHLQLENSNSYQLIYVVLNTMNLIKVD